MKRAKVYLAGAGPGDPGLVTVKTLEVLEKADCVIYDSLANKRLLEHARAGAETVFVGKTGGKKTVTQAEINAIIIKKALNGKTVVRLKGGDPFIFGRGGEEALALERAGVLFEVIPGVTSATAVPAYAGIPLTHRDFASSVTFITGEENPTKERSGIAWDKLSRGDGTLVFLMGWKNLSIIVGKLVENGRDPATPVAMVRWGTTARQESVTGTLGTIEAIAKKSGLRPPVITVVGEVVTLKEKLDWFERKPLFGKTILVTRTSEQAGEFSNILSSYGAGPLEVPTIRTLPPASSTKLDRAIKKLSSYDWVVFTSANGVRYFFDRLSKLGKDLRELKGVKVCAIGPRTEAAVKGLNIGVDLTPGEYVAEAVLKALGPARIRGKRFLLPRAERAREVLPDEIKRLGGSIDVAPAYKTVRPGKATGELRGLLKEGKIDCVTFTSSSTVTNFCKLFRKGEAGELLKGVAVACIGPVTKRTAKESGLTVVITPRKHTVPALADAIAGYYAGSASALKR